MATRRRHKFSITDIFIIFCACAIFIGSIYYLMAKEKDGSPVRVGKKGRGTKSPSKPIIKTENSENNDNHNEQPTDDKKKDDKPPEELQDKGQKEPKDPENISKDNNSGDADANGDGAKSDDDDDKDKNLDDDDSSTDNGGLNPPGPGNDSPKVDSENDNPPVKIFEDDLFEYGKLPVFFDLIKKGNVEVLAEMINLKTDMSEISGNGFNALHYAASLMQVDVMRLLLDGNLFKADEAIGVGEYAGNKALHWVCFASERYPERAIEAAELLLAHGADLKAKDRDEYTPIFGAATRGHIELVKFLLDKGEDVNSNVGEYKESLLHAAMESCKRPMLKFLIDSGADIHYVSGFNREPIHEAAAQGCVDGLKELILTRMVSKHQKSPSSKQNKCQREFEFYCMFEATPLHFAAKFEKLTAVEFLFLIKSNGAELDEKRFTASRYAADTGNLEVKNYFTDRFKWELKEIDLNGEVEDIEDEIRRLDGATDPSAISLYNHYLADHLHEKRVYKNKLK